MVSTGEVPRETDLQTKQHDDDEKEEDLDEEGDDEEDDHDEDGGDDDLCWSPIRPHKREGGGWPRGRQDKLTVVPDHQHHYDDGDDHRKIISIFGQIFSWWNFASSPSPLLFLSTK